MNSAHEAYAVVSKANIPADLQIKAIACYDNIILLGTRRGHLLMYSVSQNDDEKKMHFQLFQYDKNFSKKPITQIEVIPEYQLLFSLSDGTININNISRHNLFPLIHSTANQMKGATIFALDVKRTSSITGETALIVRVCVVIKRKLQFGYWKYDKLEFYSEIGLLEIPKALAWKENMICIGSERDYVLYDISEEKPKRIHLFPSSLTRTIDPWITIINDCFAVIKDEYLVAVDPQNEIAKQSTDDGLLAAATNPQLNQQLKSFAWTQPITVLAWDEPYAVGLHTNGIEVRILEASGPVNDTFVQLLPDIQRARYLARSKNGLFFAASLTEIWCIKNIDYRKQCKDLLENKQFQLALRIATILDISPEEKETMKNEIQARYAYHLFDCRNVEKSMEEFAKIEIDPCDVIRLFPALLPEDSSTSLPPKTTQQLVGKELELGLLALIKYLTEVRLNLLLKIQKKENKCIKNSNYLLSIIDTTLVKCYLQTNDSLVAPVIRRNHCHLEETEKTLIKYQKYENLLLLCQTKGQHKKALQFLQSQSNGQNSCLSGYERTIEYLHNLGNEHCQLIFEFSSWIIEKHPEDGLKIFTEDIPEVENMNRDKVLNFFLKNHHNLVTPYLEHIIYEWNEKKPNFHNILIQQYLRDFKGLNNEIKNKSSKNEVSRSEAKRDKIKGKLLEFLNKSKYFLPVTILSHFPDDDLFEQRAIVLGKLKLHKKVLAIHIQILGNIELAIKYCNNVYESDSNAAKTVFVLLVEILLHPPTTPPYANIELHPICLKSNLDVVFDILCDHATKIDPYAILKILPDDIPLLRLHSFLETTLNQSMERRRGNEVTKGLLYASVLQLQEQRMHLESQSVTVYEYSVCPVCSKKFNQSALVRYTNGIIVHYKCK